MKKLLLLALLTAAPIYAAEFETAILGIALGAGLSIGLAALEEELAGIAMMGALEGIANPNAYDKIFTPMIIGLALIESLVIYALVIAFMLHRIYLKTVILLNRSRLLKFPNHIH